MSLQKIQASLKAPKGQYNAFGKYKYRSTEDILEAAKPLLAAHQYSLIIDDSVEHIGERYYIKATATLFGESGKVVADATAYAREPLSAKGMSESQVTGSASSYARKYCLNGLFAIDDTQDADSTNREAPKREIVIGQENVNWLARFCKANRIDGAGKQVLLKKYGFDPYSTTPDEFVAIKSRMEADYGNN